MHRVTTGGSTVQVGVSVSARRGRRATAAVIGMTMAAGVAGCSDGGLTDGRDAVKLSLTPGDGTGSLRPDSSIAVQAQNGTIENVTVTTKGEQVEGGLNTDRTRWQSRWTLDPATKYSVTATALGRDGKTQTVTSRFTTAKVKRSVETTVEAPSAKETVGVGMPVILNFDKEVGDRAAVERALEIRSSKPVEGAWHWFNDQRVVFRTRKYWPRHTKVSFRAHLSGVRFAGGVYGTDNQNIDFSIGDEHIIKASENSHQMWVKVNDKLKRTIPVSMGRGGITKYITTNGDHLTMDKGSPVIMDSSTVGCGPGCPGYYRQTVYSAVRISDSGEYVHSAPWSVGSQGNSNVSHGCVNISPSNASWFYDLVYRGDPLEITGSARELEPENGWGFWQLGWEDWVKGSALKQSLLVGPQGATPAPPAASAPPAQAVPPAPAPKPTDTTPAPKPTDTTPAPKPTDASGG
ncbi:Ig-like domain-containing protein [Actinomadura sp. 6N118]|uniref:L,D-transpeptidase n=1 Tax=Actinomadura sp. 6N118 TaxID=3375151 RepID=UPI0037C11853